MTDPLGGGVLMPIRKRAGALAANLFDELGHLVAAFKKAFEQLL
jgi:hypothetical protein